MTIKTRIAKLEAQEPDKRITEIKVVFVSSNEPTDKPFMTVEVVDDDHKDQDRKA